MAATVVEVATSDHAVLLNNTAIIVGKPHKATELQAIVIITCDDVDHAGHGVSTVN